MRYKFLCDRKEKLHRNNYKRSDMFIAIGSEIEIIVEDT